MIFAKITNDVFGARNAGYVFDETSERQIDEEVLAAVQARVGESQLNSILDGFCDNDGDLYLGEDNNYYAVLYDYSSEPPYRAIAWQKLKHIDK